MSIFLPSKDMDVNRFVDVKLPTKRQIFSRVGANASGSLYSGDEEVHLGMKPTEQADALASAAEAYKEDLPEDSKPSDDGAAD